MEEKDLNLYRSLNKNRVKYLLVGGVAAILYGSPRITKDTDIFIERDPKNAGRLPRALKDIGFRTTYLTIPRKKPENEVSIFKDYIFLDVLTKVKGIDFKSAWKRRKIKYLRGVRVPLICMEDLILSKKAVGRSIDREDIKIFRKIKKIRANAT